MYHGGCFVVSINTSVHFQGHTLAHESCTGCSADVSSVPSNLVFGGNVVKCRTALVNLVHYRCKMDLNINLFCTICFMHQVKLCYIKLEPLHIVYTMILPGLHLMHFGINLLLFTMYI